MENGGNRIDKKQSLLVKFKIILYVDQICPQARGRGKTSDQSTKNAPKKKEKERKCLALSVNDEDERKTSDSPETQA